MRDRSLSDYSNAARCGNLPFCGRAVEPDALQVHDQKFIIANFIVNATT